MRLVDCLRTGWIVYRRNPVRLSALAVALWFAELFASGVLAALLPPRLAVPVLLLMLGLFEVGLLTCAQRAVSGETPRLSHALEPFTTRQLDYALVVLAVSAGILFAFVGLFITLVLFMFAPLYVAEGRGARDALVESARRVLGAPAQAAGLCALLACLKVVGVLSLGVGLIVTAPLSALVIVAAARAWPAPNPRPSAAVALTR